MTPEITTSFLRNASNILGDTNHGLSTTDILGICNDFAVDFDVKIPYTEQPSLGKKNKRTYLLENLKCFKAEQQFKLIRDLCEYKNQPDRDDVNRLKSMLITRYGSLVKNECTYDIILAEETKHWMANYPRALKAYKTALEKRDNKIYERNLLDDLRLSMELLLKDIFKNDKSLENQLSCIGNFVNKNNCSKELSNMFRLLIDYFSKYQNNHVKHNDKISENEIDIIVDITSAMLKAITKLNSINDINMSV